MIVYGKNVFIETIKNNPNLISKIFIKKGSERDFLPFINNKEKIYTVDNKFFQENLGKKKHQNIALEINNFPLRDYKYLKNNFKTNNIFLLLDSIKDPQNLGSIIRTAYGLNIDGLIITKDRTVGITPVVFSASSGYVNSLPIIQITNPANMIKIFKEWTYWTCYVDMNGEKNIKSDDFDIPMPVIAVMGSEGSGVRQIYKKKCDFSIQIPQKDRFDSFNLSVASSIILWELSKLK